MHNEEEHIWFHADDYGVTPEQSKRILDCYKQGILNSISVLPNSPALMECGKLLEETDPEHQIRRVLHINLVEGRPVAGTECVSMLVDEQGMFSCSFVKLWLWNYILHGNKREMLRQQLKCELMAQLQAVTDKCNYNITGIDSHQHYHMIPIVFDVLMEVLEETGIIVDEIRIPVDPLSPVMLTKDKPYKIPLVNWIKWLILKTGEEHARRILSKKEITVPVFFGIFYTCDMRYETVHTLLPAYRNYAQRKNAQLELMFHPGNLMSENEMFDTRREELADFYMSQNRYAEADCLKQIRI